MTRSSICLCAVLFAAACTDGGPGTESPITGAGTGGMGSGGMTANPTAGSGGASGTAGAAGVGGSAGSSAGQGGLGGSGGMVTGGVGGTGGMAGEDIGDEDAGVDDEGSCTAACTGPAPDESVVEACSAITEMEACESFETSGFPAGCDWMTPDSEPCLVP